MEKRWASWSRTPLPAVSLSSSGLLALADLSTIAERTALTGTSSWWDILVLAPGIHHQQSAEKLGEVQKGALAEATDLGTGNTRQVTNRATIHYFDRVGTRHDSITLDVGRDNLTRKGSKGPSFGPRAQIFKTSDPSSKLSALLYVLSPLLTITAISLMIAMYDWWGLAEIIALMVARALNIWVIQNRTQDEPTVSKAPNVHENWWVVLDSDRTICIRGLTHDLEAITTGSWMRAKTSLNGYAEAIAQMIVYMVAVLSGNITQAADIIMIVLLLSSAALLGLSNAQSKTFNMNGRVATVTGSTKTDTSPVKYSASDSGRDSKGTISDFEKSEASIVLSRTYPFNDEVNYV